MKMHSLNSLGTAAFSVVLLSILLSLMENADAFAPLAAVTSHRRDCTLYSTLNPKATTEEFNTRPPDTDTLRAKQELIDLIRSGEDENSEAIRPFLETLESAYSQSGMDARYSNSPSYDGHWRNVNFPNFPGGKGYTNDSKGRLPLYTLGRLTFNQVPKQAQDVVVAAEKMTHVVFSYDSDINTALPTQVPEHLEKSIAREPNQLLGFYIDVHFQVHHDCDSDNDNRESSMAPLRGMLRTKGCAFPHPNEPNRFDSWFLGGTAYAMIAHGKDYERWNTMFGSNLELSSESLKLKRIRQWIKQRLLREKQEQGKVSMMEDVAFSYSLDRLVPAHATVLYLDDDLRITSGQRGSCMINVREDYF